MGSAPEPGAPVCRGRLMAVIRLMGAKIPADFNSEDGMGARARPPPCARARLERRLAEEE